MAKAADIQSVGWRFDYDPTAQANANARVGQQTSVCHQHQLRVQAYESEPRPTLESLADCRVVRISKAEALPIIERYEWLGTLGQSMFCYGLKTQDGELLGVASFGMPGGTEATKDCGQEYARRSICLMRGACVHYAPYNAPSYLINHSCRQLAKETDYCIFFAYADEAAGEIGAVYQAAGWLYLGRGLGHPAARNYYRDPEGRVLSSRALYGEKKTWSVVKDQGWVKLRQPAKHKYIHFEGSRKLRATLLAALKWPTKPWPTAQVPKRDIPNRRRNQCP